MIPAGIQKGETEFFEVGNQLVAMHEGALTQLEDLPEYALRIVDDHINHKAAAALDNMGISDVMERRKQFLKCNCGSFDFTPDIVAGSGVLNMEYVDCSIRHVCNYNGLLCQPITINGHRVTMTELKVASFIRKGLYDKEICGEMNIEQDTLRTHKKRIQIKLGANRKTQIATQAIKLGIS